MASNRTTLDFSFVALVLSVNGRARIDDLQSIPAVQRAQLLQAYYDAYSASEPLHFEGDVLVRGAAPVGSGPSAVPPAAMPVAVPVMPTVDAPATAAPGPMPMPMPAAQPSAPAPLPGAPDAPAVPDFFGPSAYESASAPAPVAEPVATPAPPSAQAAPESKMTDDFFNIPVPAPSGPPAFFEGVGGTPELDASVPAASAPKASFVFWLLPVLLAWVGGLIAFFVVRGKNALQARAMLLTGIVLTVVYALIAYALVTVGVFGLGMFAFNAGNNIPPAAVTAAQPSVAADYPKWTVDKDHGIVLAHLTSSKNPAATVRQDHYYEVASPNARMHIVAWYARTGATTETLRSTVWVNPDALFRGTDGSSDQATSLAASMTNTHPTETLLGAYPVGKPVNGVTTYNVGWAAGSDGTMIHGEHVYSYSASSGWHQVSEKSKSTSAWNTTGAFK